MRVRNLKPLSFGPGTVVYQGGWQGLLVAVKFNLCRRDPGSGGGACGGSVSAGGDGCGTCGGSVSAGGDGGGGGAEGVQRQLASLLATHCTPQRSAVARVYACDASVVVAAAPSAGATEPHGRVRPSWPASEGAGGAPPPAAPGDLAVRPCGSEVLDLGLCCESLPADLSLPVPCGHSLTGDRGGGAGEEQDSDAEAEAEVEADGEDQLGGSRGSAAPLREKRRSGAQAPRFHFSSVVYCEGPAAMPEPATAPGRAPPPRACHAAPALSPALIPASPGDSCRSTSPFTTTFASTATSPGSPERGHGVCAAAAAAAAEAPPTSTADAADAVADAAADVTAADTTAPDLTTLSGLLRHLGARPGDLLIHTVMELSTIGNLWRGVRSGIYDMAAAGSLGPRFAARMLVRSARGVAAGLAQLHAAGDVHGAVTPSNVLLQWSDAREDDADGGDGGVRRRHVSSSGGGGGGGGSERTLTRRRGLAARLADCGMRRLVAGTSWRGELDCHPELRACTAPEVLAVPAGSEVQWRPSHDMYSFGALLFAMCTGALPQRGHHGAPAQPTGAAAAAGSTHIPLAPPPPPPPPPSGPPAWPPSVWAPLRSLGQACMSADPAARPSAPEVIKTLLLWEQRLRAGGRPRLHGLSTPPSPQFPGGAGAGTLAGAGAGASGAYGAVQGPATYPGAALWAAASSHSRAGWFCGAPGPTGMPMPAARSATAIAHVAIVEGSAEGECTSVEAEVEAEAETQEQAAVAEAGEGGDAPPSPTGGTAMTVGRCVLVTMPEL